MAKKIRVFLADDHPVVREGLKALINSQTDMEVVGEAADGLEARNKLLECKADVAVIDLSMPGLNGTQLTEWLTEKCSDIKVIALTVHEDRAYLKRLIQAGAKGYVLKRAAADELIRALHKVVAGDMYLDPSMTGELVRGLLQQGSSAIRSSGKQLSSREAEVARLIAQGYSNKDIASRLEISVKTVETHKARIMEKLGFQSRVELVRYAMDQGWLQSA
jgi:DNA-binding NarL/FixJ family response regulator